MLLKSQAVVLLFSLAVAGAADIAWGPLHSTRCSEKCLGMIDTATAVDTCYGTSQGKPVKACLSGYRDAVKKSCAKVCDQGDLG